MKSGTELIRYDAACRALALAKTVDEAKNIHDKADAVRAYARQAGNKKLEIDACEIRILAERRLGELLRQTEKAKGQLLRGARKEPREDILTLAEFGIAKKLSSRAQKLAAVPKEIFHEKLSQWRLRIEEENERVTTNLLKIGEDGQKHVRGTFGTSENEWYTPAEYLELAQQVMGAIDLDPASSDFGQTIVGAKQYFTPVQNGLKQEWHGRVWLNPPYSQPDIALFVSKLILEHQAGRTTAAILLTHNYTDTAWFHEAVRVSSAICFTRGRVKFHDEKGTVAAPTQGQALFYFGEDIAAFAMHFQGVGFIVLPYRGKGD